MKLLTALRYLWIHIRNDWLRSLLSMLSVAALVCVYLMSSGMINDLQRLGRSLLRFPESLLLVFHAMLYSRLIVTSTTPSWLSIKTR